MRKVFFLIGFVFSMSSSPSLSEDVGSLSSGNADIMRTIIWGREVPPFDGPMLRWEFSEVLFASIYQESRKQDFLNHVMPAFENVSRTIKENAGVSYTLSEEQNPDGLARGYLIYGNRSEVLDFAAQLFSIVKIEDWRAIFEKQERLGLPLCTVMLAPNDFGEIKLAVVTVESGPRQTECVYEEIFQSTGLINDVNSDERSILSANDTYVVPTELDELLLSALYSLELPRPNPPSLTELSQVLEKIERKR